MKYALVNPPWSFEGSIYFGCREPHLPLEYGYSKALLERAGHEV
jgi:anaerobic magnesium-protoporphyrin IX monomethyl ester cyclase